MQSWILERIKKYVEVRTGVRPDKLLCRTCGEEILAGQEVCSVDQSGYSRGRRLRHYECAKRVNLV